MNCKKKKEKTVNPDGDRVKTVVWCGGNVEGSNLIYNRIYWHQYKHFSPKIPEW